LSINSDSFTHSHNRSSSAGFSASSPSDFEADAELKQSFSEEEDELFLSAIPGNVVLARLKDQSQFQSIAQELVSWQHNLSIIIALLKFGFV